MSENAADRPVILVDADACPVKEEIYKVAFRTGAGVIVVANQPIRVPRHENIRRVTVGEGMDVADDWIAAEAGPGAIVITADIPLAERCLAAGAQVLAPNGKPFTDDMIGAAVATRALMNELRAGAEGVTGGPPPFQKKDRSRFLSALDEAVMRARRR